MAASLLLDEDVPVKVGAVLASLGHNVEYWRAFSVHKGGDRLDDALPLQEAMKAKRAVLTVNGTDLELLHTLMRGHYGIIIYRHLTPVRGRDMVEAAARVIDAGIREWQQARGVLHGRVFTLKQIDGSERLVCDTPDLGPPRLETPA